MPRVTRPSTQARRRRETESRCDSVLRSAEAVFLEDGYQGATTDRIAGRAGVSVGTVYNFFGNKEKLYATVIERVGQELLDHVRDNVLPLGAPDAAVESLVHFRLANYNRHRLLLALFSGERASGACPSVDSVSDAAKGFYYGYLDLVAQVFERGMDARVYERMNPLHLALSFEGVLSALVGYWMRPGRKGHLESQARHVKEVFMGMAGLKRAPAPAPGEETLRSREVFVTSLDMSRLTELITVARAFGNEDNAAHLDELETELKNSRVVDPSAVPGDVVTMNSRVRLRELPSGGTRVCNLVFPVDADTGPDSLSVLDPLGTALLGRRVGTVVETAMDGRRAGYELTDLLYQPEAAGEFHR